MWEELARPEQVPPPGDWFVWLIMAGRGWGKTRTAAEWAAGKARRYPRCRVALVAATIADARDTMVEGESGLLACLDDAELRGGSRDSAWNRSLGELYLANGSRFKTFSSEKPWRLRGPQFHFAWGDESAFWDDAAKGVAADTTWSNLVIATRLPARAGWDAEYRTQVCVATTPRPVSLLRSRDPDPARAGLTQRATTVITRGSTSANLANLSEAYKAQVVEPLQGTRLGRQELDAEILEDVEGALWTLAMIDADRAAAHPDLARVVVAVDPSGGSGPGSDEQGIVVAGLGVDGDVYVLADRSCKLSPHGWASRAVGAFREFTADRIVAERNFGGDMVESTIGQVDAGVPVKVITASRGKVQRAEPVAAAYEKHRVHHVGSFTRLEDQMCTWTPVDGTSPDRMDALVWAVTELTGNFGADAWIAWARRKAEEAQAGAEETGEDAGPAASGHHPEVSNGTAPAVPGTVPFDPVAARQAARTAAFRAQA